MSSLHSPQQIIQTLLPHLRAAAGYAQQIQNKIISLPDKDVGDNFLSALVNQGMIYQFNDI